MQLPAVAFLGNILYTESQSTMEDVLTKKEKLISKLLQRPKDFTWGELSSLLKSLGYKESKTGKSGGSRRKFIHDSAPTIMLHKPHPKNVLKLYAIDQIIEMLKNEGML